MQHRRPLWRQSAPLEPEPDAYAKAAARKRRERARRRAVAVRMAKARERKRILREHRLIVARILALPRREPLRRLDEPAARGVPLSTSDTGRHRDLT